MLLEAGPEAGPECGAQNTEDGNVCVLKSADRHVLHVAFRAGGGGGLLDSVMTDEQYSSYFRFFLQQYQTELHMVCMSG